MVELPQGTVTFLFTDIEGSTRLLKALGDRYGEVLEAHRRILREAAQARGGREVDTQGDSFFFAFARANAALGAAVVAQRALSEHEWPDGAEVRVRMGMHTAEPEVGEERYVGLGVHRAARIGAAAHGGQVLLVEQHPAAGGGRCRGRVGARARSVPAQGLRPGRAAVPTGYRRTSVEVPPSERAVGPLLAETAAARRRRRTGGDDRLGCGLRLHPWRRERRRGRTDLARRDRSEVEHGRGRDRPGLQVQPDRRRRGLRLGSRSERGHASARSIRTRTRPRPSGSPSAPATSRSDSLWERAQSGLPSFAG